MIETKKHLKKLTRTGVPSGGRIGQVYRFDRNEKTTPFPLTHLKKILDHIHPDEMIAYPDLDPLYDKLSSWLKVDRDQVLLSSGSDTMIKAVYEVYVEEGDEVVILSPTYGMYYVYGRMFGASTKEVTYDDDLSLPVDRILKAINTKTKLVALANPNHTGTVIQEKDLLKVVEAAQKVNALVLMDEAYFHFHEGTMQPHIHSYDNLLIIRTFSKAFGIAPLRVGYAVSNKEIISHLHKVKLTHEVTMFGAKVALYMLEHLRLLDDYMKDVQEAKDVLYARLPDMGFEVLKSEANFVYFKPPAKVDGSLLMAELEKKKIFLKGPFGKPPFSGHIRVTVGTAEQMNMMCDEITKIVQSILIPT